MDLSTEDYFPAFDASMNSAQVSNGISPESGAVQDNLSVLIREVSWIKKAV